MDFELEIIRKTLKCSLFIFTSISVRYITVAYLWGDMGGKFLP